MGYLKDRLQSRVEGWDKKFLSNGGKEILLKTVAQAIPTYAMDVFLLPMELCKNLERIMCRYWWKNGAERDWGIHWLSWERLTKRKSEGGMGFQNLYEFNLAMVGKQGWRLMVHHESLVARIYKARYYPNESFVSAKLGCNPSYIWHGVIVVQDLIQKGVVRSVGNGRSVYILGEPWLPYSKDPFIHLENKGLRNQMVASIFSLEEDGWDKDILNDMFEQGKVQLIESIHVRRQESDGWYWKHEKMGQYTVKNAYLSLQSSAKNNQSSNSSGFWRKLWNLKVPPKIKNFIWRAARGCLPTKDRLRVKKVNVNISCPSCNDEPEFIMHVLVNCSLAKSCWDIVGMNVLSNTHHNFADWLDAVMQMYRGNDVRLKVMIYWALWKARNKLVWNQKGGNVVEIVSSTNSMLNQWSSAQDKTFNHFLGLMTGEDGDEHWTLPAIDKVKLNTNIVIFEESNCYSFSLVARNHKGEVVDTVAKCKSGRIDITMEEIMGIREALTWVKAQQGSQEWFCN